MVIVMARLVYGVGINDANYTVKPMVDGKQVCCPFYAKWVFMLTRCYNEKHLSRRPTYKECVVCEEWLTFSNFRKWMNGQDWEGKELDKDLLVDENKIYSPETCVFIDSYLNLFLSKSAGSRGDYLIGVSWHVGNKALQSYCRNPITGKLEHLGYFNDELSAHMAWKKRKHELACLLAEKQDDERIADALRRRYA